MPLRTSRLARNSTSCPAPASTPGVHRAGSMPGGSSCTRAPERLTFVAAANVDRRIVAVRTDAGRRPVGHVGAEHKGGRLVGEREADPDVDRVELVNQVEAAQVPVE